MKDKMELMKDKMELIFAIGVMYVLCLIGIGLISLGLVQNYRDKQEIKLMKQITGGKTNGK